MSNLVPKYSGPYGEKFDAAYSEFEAVITKFKDTLKDGFQVGDLVNWHSLVVDSYGIAKTIFLDGFGRDEVTEITRYIYWAIDPNWPWIPEPLETQFENWIIIDLALPMAVNAAWDAVAGYKDDNGS